MEIRALAIIPARGGSKRLPRKNALPLGDKPLIAHTLEAAIKSECFANILFSSDDDELLAIAKQYPQVQAEKREDRLATDTVKVIDLIREIANDSTLANQYNVITLLLPTCPFRQGKDIREGFKLLTPEIDVVVSATTYDFPHQNSINVDTQNSMYPSESLLSGNTRSQDLGAIYHPNGGFYIAWWESFQRLGSWWTGKGRAYLMDSLYSADIDDAQDMDYARWLIETGKVTIA